MEKIEYVQYKSKAKIITLPNGEKINVDWSSEELEKHVKVIDWDYRLFSGRKFAMISHDGHDDMIWIWFNYSETKITAISGFTKKFLIEYKIWKRYWWN